MIKAKVKKKTEARRSAGKAYKKISRGADDGLKEASIQTVRNVKKIMSSGNRSGRLYPSNRNDGSMHRASRAGEPLASDTGDLERSIRYQRGGANAIKRGRGVKTYHVGSPRKKMRWEVGDNSGKGTPKPGAARPTLKAGLIRNLRVKDIERAIRKALK